MCLSPHRVTLPPLPTMGTVVAVVLPSRVDVHVPTVEKDKECCQMTGSVKKVVAERGFGFIAAEDGAEYFFHRSGVDSSLSFETLVGGERVSFEVDRGGDKGPRARDVRAG